MLNAELKPKTLHPKQASRNICYNTMGKTNQQLLITERGSGQNVTKTNIHKLNAQTRFGHTLLTASILTS